MMNANFPIEVILFKESCADLNVLKKLNFRMLDLEYIPPTKVVSESYQINLENESNRRIEIIYHPEPGISGIFLFYIYQTSGNQPVELGDWLKKHKKLAEPNPFKLSSYSGEYKERLKKFFDFLSSVLSNSAMQEILKGNAWEDIPFDWTGIK